MLRSAAADSALSLQLCIGRYQEKLTDLGSGLDMITNRLGASRESELSRDGTGTHVDKLQARDVFVLGMQCYH